MEFTTIQTDVLNALQAGEATAQDIATQIEQPKGDTAKALGELYTAGIVTRDLRNKKLYYQLAQPVEQAGEETQQPAPAEEQVNEVPAAEAPQEEQPAAEEVPAQPAKKATKAKGKADAKKATTKAETKPKPTPAKDVIAAIRKAKTEDAVNKLVGDDTRKSVVNAATKQIAKLNAPAPAPKPKKEPKGKPVKKAPAAEFINEDGTLDYDKLSKAKRGDVVEFEGWGTNPVTEGIVLFPDWDFWQAKTYLRIYSTQQNKEVWKSVDKITKIRSKKDAKAYIKEHNAAEYMGKKPAPAWREWKVELCLKARNGK